MANEYRRIRVCGLWSERASRAESRKQKAESRKKELVLNLEFEILNLFGIWDFEFGISAGLPAAVCGSSISDKGCP